MYVILYLDKGNKIVRKCW